MGEGSPCDQSCYLGLAYETRSYMPADSARPSSHQSSEGLRDFGGWKSKEFVLVVLYVCALTTSVLSAPPRSISGSLHNRISQVCSQTFTGAEGSHLEGFQLDKVFVAATPGLTAPLNHAASSAEQTQNSAAECLFEKFATHHHSEKVQSYPSAARMKDRLKKNHEKSFKHYRRYRNSVNCETNSITPHGIAQLIHVGEFLSARYTSQLSGLQTDSLSLDAAMAAGDEVLYQALSALLHGLLNEEQFMQSRIKKYPVFFTNENCGQKSNNCKIDPELHNLIQSSFHSESHILKGGEPLFFQVESKILHEKPVSPAKLIIAQIASRICNQENKGDLQMTIDDIDSVFHMSDSFNSYISSNVLFKKYAHTRTLPFFNMIFEWLRLDNEVSQSDNLKIVSMDDLMMMSILATVGQNVDQHQTPASRLVLEVFKPTTTAYISKLFEDQNTTSNLNTGIEKLAKESDNGVTSLESIAPKYVRILYNGDVITSSLQSCKHSPLVDIGLCDVNAFSKEIKNLKFVDFKNEL